MEFKASRVNIIGSKKMKLVSWNCGGAFRKKCQQIEDVYQPDIFVIQECEDPARSTQAYKEWAGSYLWVGDNKNKGLGIFDRSGIGLRALDWDAGELESFLPSVLGNGVMLVAVWTKYASSPNFRYIGQMWKYLQLHRERLAASNPLLIAGDFNSNTCWDEWDRWWNHSDVVRELSEIGIESFYHHYLNEAQGQESHPTLYHRYNKDKPYHVDYVFGSREFLKDGGISLAVGDANDWLAYSDHMPIEVSLAH